MYLSTMNIFEKYVHFKPKSPIKTIIKTMSQTSGSVFVTFTVIVFCEAAFRDAESSRCLVPITTHLPFERKFLYKGAFHIKTLSNFAEI